MAKNTVELFFLGDSRSAQRAAGELQAALGQTQNKTQQTAASLTAWGGKLTKGVTLPMLAAGGAFLAAGNQVDAGLRTIRAGTGATGEALDGLVTEMKDVAATVPTSIGDTSKVIADFNTGLGLTGDQLEEVTRRTIEMNRMMGGDLNQQVNGIIRVFGDWGIAAEDQADTLDKLFRTSQSTGISIENLTGLMVRSGAPLRQLGFTFEESAALMGKFEREGVNTEAVLGGLRISLGKMAQAGEEPIEVFRRTVEEIKNAGSAGQANMKALELFGARAGPDMAAAIREGRLELDDYIDAIENGEETILGAAEETRTLGDHLGIMANQAALAAAPLGGALVDATTSLMPLLQGTIGLVSQGVEMFAALPAPVQQGAAALAGIALLAGPVMSLGGVVLRLTDRLRQYYLGLAAVRSMSGQTVPSMAALTGVLGGVTIAVGAAIAVWASHARQQAESRARIEAISDTLDEQTGAVTDNTEAWVANQLEQSGALRAAQKLGISLGDVQAAALGNEDALARVGSALDGFFYIPASRASSISESVRRGFEGDAAAAWDLQNALGQLGPELEAATESTRRQAEATAEAEGKFASVQHAIDSGLDPVLAGLAVRHQNAADAAGDQEVAQEDLEEQTEDTTTAIERQRDAIDKATNPVFRLLDAVEGVDKASADYEATLADVEASEEDRTAAALAHAEALARLEVAATDGTLSFEVFEARLQGWVASGKLTADEAARIRDRVAEARGELERVTGDYPISVHADVAQALQALNDLELALEDAQAAAAALSRSTGMGLTVTEGGAIVPTGVVRHGGGVVGDRGPRRSLNRLSGRERVVVAEDGEEVLTADDPRHVRNLGRGGGDAAGIAGPALTQAIARAVRAGLRGATFGVQIHAAADVRVANVMTYGVG